MFNKWLEDVNNKYYIDILVKDGENHFIKKTYEFSDPKFNGLSFSIAINDLGMPSLFNTNDFFFSHFNIAEDYSSDQILIAANNCLNGNVTITQKSKTYTLDVGPALGHGEKISENTISKIKDHLKKYSLKRGH